MAEYEMYVRRENKTKILMEVSGHKEQILKNRQEGETVFLAGLKIKKKVSD